jgi:hypothetical protein
MSAPESPCVDHRRGEAPASASVAAIDCHRRAALVADEHSESDEAWSQYRGAGGLACREAQSDTRSVRRLCSVALVIAVSATGCGDNLSACPMEATCAGELPEGWSGYYELYDNPSHLGPSDCTPGFDQFDPAGYVAPVSGGAFRLCPACPPPEACQTPSGSGPCVLTELFWTGTAVRCTAVPVDGVCVGPGSCRPSPGLPYLPGLCILHSSDVACPADTLFVERHVLYMSVDDNRDCASCLCRYRFGTCQQIGGNLTGSVTPAEPVTYCCMP